MTEVLETRNSKDGSETRRRRQCLRAACKARSTTIEAEMKRVVAYVVKPRGPNR
jgi:transcriptional regulator NrdR family protein